MPSYLAWILMLLLLSVTVAGTGASAASAPAPYRVNAPHFSNGLVFDETAVFWLGRVTPSENYADVRVGYHDSALWVHVNVIDLRLWYDTSPSASALTDWDSATLYLDKRGNTGSAPAVDSYRFDAQLNWWEPRDGWQTAYQGNGASWAATPISFTTYNNWYGASPPNYNDDEHGWFVAFRIPFSSLGLSGPPPQGTIWGLGIAVHDRDTATGPINPDKTWPETMSFNQPASWGQLHFGVPTYAPPAAAAPQGTTVIRQGLNGQIVQDGVVGGNTLCGGNLSDYFQQWGNLNYAHEIVFNVQNVERVSEWPCFSKAFVTFPLTAVPAAKSIISASLTLYHRGNPGPAPEPAYIQVLTVNQDWNEDTLTWNNAPLARENLGGVWIPSVSAAPPEPGIPYTWDVSRAVAGAYSAGLPLRLALYSASSPFHNGRYFHSSDVDDFNAVGRPTLTIVWGVTGGAVQARVQPAFAEQNDTVTYTLSLLGNGQALTLTDNLPALVSAPKSLQAIGGEANYIPALHRVEWHGTITSGLPATITFPVDVLASNPQAIGNTAQLLDAQGNVTSDTAWFIANGHNVYLPITMR